MYCFRTAGGHREGSTIRACNSLCSSALVGLFALVVSAGVAGGGTHTVRPGETATSIAKANGISVDALAAANRLADPDLVVIGTTLVIPASSGAPAGAPATTYTVKPGDTLTDIAARWGTTPDALAKANGLRNPNIVILGSILQVPAPSALGADARLPAKLLAHPERLSLRPTFERWAARYGVPADLLEALCWVESGWQSSVVSSTGAIGVGQLMPQTIDLAQSALGANLDPRDPQANIRMSAWFLGSILRQTGGNVPVTVAAYYQGLKSVRTRPLYEDTKQYVAAVLALRSRFA